MLSIYQCMPSAVLYMNSKLVTKYQIPVINICWEKCNEKCTYMLNVYKSQLSRKTGSRNLTGQKTLPTKWGTYMKLVTKYQLSVINICWEKWAYMGPKNASHNMKLVTKYQISAINICWGKCDEKWAYICTCTCSMWIKINKVDKQEVGIWRVQKRYPQYGIPIWSLWPNIRFLPSIVAEKNILDGRTEVKQYTLIQGAGV
jgi:hypothetical protein